jgi:hypothetical protein
MNDSPVKSIVVGMSITLCVLTTACSKESPTAPAPPSTTTPNPPPSTTTRIIRLGGDLNFGNLSLAGNPVKDGVLTVSNDGSDTLQVSGISGDRCAGTYITAQGPTSFAVPPGGTASVGFRFAPRVRIDCSGTMTVVGDQTSGTNTIAVTARGVQPGCETAPDPLPPPCLP